MLVPVRVSTLRISRRVSTRRKWRECFPRFVPFFDYCCNPTVVDQSHQQFGTIFDSRWPSKRFVNTRRFVYIQFTNAVSPLVSSLLSFTDALVTQASAEAALSLHNTELEPNLKIAVYISDPGKKKGRTDAKVHERELYVASLAKSVKEYDLRKLFEPVRLSFLFNG